MLKIAGIVLGVLFALGLVLRIVSPERRPAVRDTAEEHRRQELATKVVAGLKSAPVTAAPVVEPKADLELVGGINGTKGVTNDSGMTITGRVRNNKGKAYRYAQITFTVYNKADEQVGTALANIAGLDPDGTWRFEARCFCPTGRTFRLAGITGY
jgi:hypothetical protein